MKVTINVTSNFKKQAKPLLKKYPSLKEEKKNNCCLLVSW